MHSTIAALGQGKNYHGTCLSEAFVTEVTQELIVYLDSLQTIYVGKR
jgi:hypothetical protein